MGLIQLHGKDGVTVALIEELDDRSLVEQHRSGDDDAFRQIVLRHHRSLYANALRRLGDPVLAEDAVQETFLRAFRSLDGFDGDYHLDAWLHRIVTNACHDIGRRRARDRRLFDRACTTVEADAPAADETVADVTGAVDAALGQLPASYREVLILRFVEELSYSDVAMKAGISEENARARVSRGRNMLKRLMSSTSALLLWAIPPLRRAQLQVQDPEAASQAAQRVQDLAGITNVVSTSSAAGWAPLTNLVAQAAPTVVNVTPAVTGAGHAVKVAVAAGLAAAVAIPTGVAVDRAIEKPVPHAAAPLVEDQDGAGSADDDVEVASSTQSSPLDGSDAEQVSALSADGTAGISGTAGTVTDGTTQATPDAGSAPGSAMGSEHEPSTSVPPDGSSGSVPPPQVEPPPPATEPPPPAAPAPSGELRGAELVAADAGPSAVHLSGSISLTIGEQVANGSVDGKLRLGDGDPKDAKAPRPVDAALILRMDDGSVLELRLAGSAVVTDQGPTRTLDLDVRFALEGGAAVGLAESGTLAGTLVTRDGTATLGITIPGRSS